MKKILLAFLICCMGLSTFATPVNISTGFNNTGYGQLETNNWKVSYGSTVLAQPYTVAILSSWEPTPVAGCNARWIDITPVVSGHTATFYTYERIINVPTGIQTLVLNFRLACDDILNSLELVDPSGTAIPITGVVAFGNKLSATKIVKQDVCNKSGDWKLRAKVEYNDQWGGFLLCGTADFITGPVPCNCPCNLLQQNPPIYGPRYFCLKPNCNQILTFSTTNYTPSNCFKYTWAISGGGVSFTGQGTNQIQFNCNSLKCGITYAIKVTISCGNTTVTNTIKFTVCCAPDPTFSTFSTSTGATFTPMIAPGGATNYWFVFNDNDNSCGWSAGDVPIPGAFPITTGGMAAASATGLVSGQMYCVYHYAINNCGGQSCWSLQIACFKYLPPVYFKSTTGAKPNTELKPVSQRLSSDIKDIPEEFRKELPKELFEERKEEMNPATMQPAQIKE